MPSDHEVGSILGYLRLDRSDWSNELRLAGAEADKLASHNPNIRIGTNAPSAIAQLAAVAAATRRLQDAQGAEGVAQAKLADLRAAGTVSAGKLAAAEEKVQKAHRATAAATVALAAAYDQTTPSMARAAAETDRVSHSLSGMTTAALGLGPALVPLGAVAVGAFAGLAPLAATAMLAVKGLRNEMQAGQLAGTEFGKDISYLQGQVGLLERTASAGVLDGLEKGVAALRPQMPALNKDVGVMSAQLGDIVGHAGPGLLALFDRLSPLFQTFGDDVDRGSAAFQRWAQTSGSVSTFVAYVQQELPQVEQTLGNLATTAGHLVQGLEPLGSRSLSALNLLSQAVNSIPVGVLQAAVPPIAGLTLGLKAMSIAQAAGQHMQDFGDKMSEAGGIAEEIGGKVGKLGKFVGALGPFGAAAGFGLGVVSSVMGIMNRNALESQARINDLTKAMENGTGAAQLWATAQQMGLGSATKMGVQQSKLMSALEGSKSAMNDVQHQLDSYQQTQDSAALAAGRFGASSQYVSQRQGEVAGDVDNVRTHLKQLQGEYEKAKHNVADFAAKQGDSALAAEVLNGKINDSAKALHMTADDYYSARLAADKNKQSTDQQTLAYQAMNNAMGLVDQAFKTLNGQNLDVAQAQTSLAQSVMTTAGSFKQNGDAITGNSQAALSNQQVVESSVQAARQLASAVAQQTGSNDQAIISYRNSKAALERQLKAQGDLTPAVQAYIDKLYGVSSVSDYLKKHPTQIDVDKAAADKKLDALNTYLHSLTDRQYHINLALQTQTIASSQALSLMHKAGIPVHEATGGTIPHLAAGGTDGPSGTVRGPGSGTSDSILTYLSNGEEVIRASQAAQWRPLLKAINNGNLDALMKTPASSAQQAPAVERTPIVQQFYPQAPMDANAVGAAAARWLVAQGI